MTEQFADLTIDALKEIAGAMALLTDKVRMLHEIHEREIIRLHERVSDLENRVSGHTVAMLDLGVIKSNDFTGL